MIVFLNNEDTHFNTYIQFTLSHTYLYRNKSKPILKDESRNSTLFIEGVEIHNEFQFFYKRI